ncbi:MAG: hypothetical protein HKO53_06170 [Gemmatimonadetes bacterium]|nr:hypothetical protein [Gemmatimonadota bacterium]
MTRQGWLWEGLLWVLAGVTFALASTLPRTAETRFDPSSRATGAYRVMTWNVGISLDSGSGPLRAEHLDAVAATLAAAGPDLCFLQEVEGPGQARDLLRALGSGWSSMLSEPHDGRHVLALVRRPRARRMSELDHVSGTLGVRVRTDAGHRIAAVGVHADAFSSQLRNRVLGSVVDALQDQATPLRFLLGDFNLDMDLDKRRDLFTDDQHRDVETYNFVAAALQDAARDGGSTAEPDRRLDYIFVSDDVTVLQAGPWPGRRQPGMDHDPVLADLRLP